MNNTSTNRLQSFLCILMLAFSMTACASSSEKKLKKEKAAAQVQAAVLDLKVKKLESDYTAYRQDLSDTDLVLVTALDRIGSLDICAGEFRAKILETQNFVSRSSINSNSAYTSAYVKALVNVVSAKKTECLAIVSDLESTISKESIQELREHLNRHYADDDAKRAAVITTLNKVQSSVSDLAGIRDLFLGMWNDLVDELDRAGVNPETAAPETPPTDTRAPLSSDVNPLDIRPEEGGTVRGVVRNAVTGRAVSGAQVLFKKERESSDYFWRTYTNEEGAYLSPALVPGTYYVDVRSDQYISTNQPVQILRGQESQGNASLSTQLEESQIRITVSWTSEKQNAVRDVDSYLMIPHAVTPIFYGNMRGRGVFLDRDDTDWIGPETVTISELLDGEYVYWVNNYDNRSNTSALGNSNIRVQVYQGNREAFSVSVPQGSGINYEVFRIKVRDGVPSFQKTQVFRSLGFDGR